MPKILSQEKYTVGGFIRKTLLNLNVDDVVRFPISKRTSIHAQVEDLRQFGENGVRSYYGTVTHKPTNETVVVRLA